MCYSHHFHRISLIEVKAALHDNDWDPSQLSQHKPASMALHSGPGKALNILVRKYVRLGEQLSKASCKQDYSP